MPYRAPTACRPGCPHPRATCPAHPATRWADGAHGRPMPPGWSATRRRILARDGHRCRSCGAPAAEVHHTDPAREDDDSLLSLCEACHLPLSIAQAVAAAAAARP